jgi:hypothetical protein
MVDVASNASPLRLTLSRGARYAVRVLEQNSQPVVAAEVSIGPVSGSLTQAQFRYYLKTDGEGRVEFPNVPGDVVERYGPSDWPYRGVRDRKDLSWPRARLDLFRPRSR